MSAKRNSAYGFLGFLIPTLVLFVCYPILVKHLGLPALGIYLLATSLSGTLGFLDVGFAAATLKYVAEDLALGKLDDAADVIAASLIFYTVLGIALGGAFWFAAPWLVNRFQIDPAMHNSAQLCFRLGAIQFGIFLCLSVFMALFKGMQLFQFSTLCTGLLSALTFGGAVIAVLLFHQDVVGVTASSLASNIVILAYAAFTALQLCQQRRIHVLSGRPTATVFRRMFAFGSVMTVNQLAAISLTQVQKYFIGILISPAAVAVWQTAIIPASKVHAAINSFTEVMFPITSASTNRLHLRRIYLKMLGASAIVSVAAYGPFLVLRQPIMRIWLKGANTQEVVRLLPFVIIGYFLIALSPAPFHLVNGLGKAWITTIFSAIAAFVNLGCIALFTLHRITLVDFAWAFLIANIASYIPYQIAVELLVWRNWNPAGTIAYPDKIVKIT